MRKECEKIDETKDVTADEKGRILPFFRSLNVSDQILTL